MIKPVDPPPFDPNQIETLIGHQRAERDYLGEHLLTELHKVMPWGHEFELPNGAKAKLVEINNVTGASVPKRKPVYDKDDGTAAVPEGAKIIGYEGPWRMIFDFKLTNCDQDHIELTLEVTGGGGPV